MRAALVLLLVSLLSCNRESGGAGGGGTLAEIVERGHMLVGIELGFEPFEGVDETGEYVGFDIDLARGFAKELGVESRFVPMEWTALQTALPTGKIDMIWSGMTSTVERSKRILFSDAYFRTRLYLLVHKDSGIASSADMKGKRLAVKLGTTGETAAANLFPECPRVPFDDENLCATEVATGRVDAFLYDRFSVERQHKANAATTRIVTDVKGFEPYAVGLRPGDWALWRSLNLYLDKIRWDGRYAAIHSKHFGAPPDEPR